MPHEESVIRLRYRGVFIGLPRLCAKVWKAKVNLNPNPNPKRAVPIEKGFPTGSLHTVVTLSRNRDPQMSSIDDFLPRSPCLI